jgi:hypothetical protein
MWGWGTHCTTRANLKTKETELTLEKSKFSLVTAEEPALGDLFKIIYFNCKLETKNLCGGKNVPCRMYEMNCIAVCKSCNGTSYLNCGVDA